MANSRDPTRYPVLFFEAFDQARSGEVRLSCPSPTAASNLRSQLYTLRRVLADSPEPWHQDLYQAIQYKKFYLDGTAVVISEPKLEILRTVKLEPTDERT